MIPYYNFEYFQSTLDSLAAQTDKRFKVYIGNDASQTNPLELLKNYDNSIDFMYHRFENNLGQKSLVLQWKRCIEMIENESWIQILGDDDVLPQNFVSEFYHHKNKIEDKEIQVTRYASQQIDAAGNINSQVYNHPEIENSIDSFERYFNKKTRSSLSEHIFSRRAYEKYGFYDFPLAWYSDTLAWIQFSESKPIYSINQATVLVRHSAHNITGKKDNFQKKYEGSYQFYKIIVQQYFNRISKQLQNQVFEEYINYAGVTRNFTFENWKIIGWIAIKRLDLKTLVHITLKTFKKK